MTSNGRYSPRGPSAVLAGNDFLVQHAAKRSSRRNTSSSSKSVSSSTPRQAASPPKVLQNGCVVDLKDYERNPELYPYLVRAKDYDYELYPAGIRYKLPCLADDPNYQPDLKKISLAAARDLVNVYVSFFPTGAQRLQQIRTAAAATAVPRVPKKRFPSPFDGLPIDISDIRLGTSPVATKVARLDPEEYEMVRGIPLFDFQTCAYFLADKVLDDKKRDQFLESLFFVGEYHASLWSGRHVYQSYPEYDHLDGVHYILTKIVKYLAKEAYTYQKSGNENMEFKFNRLVILGDRLLQLSTEFTLTKDSIRYDHERVQLGKPTAPSMKDQLQDFFKELGLPYRFDRLGRLEVLRKCQIIMNAHCKDMDPAPSWNHGKPFTKKFPVFL